MTYPQIENLNGTHILRLLTFIICVSVFAGVTLAQRTGIKTGLTTSSALAAPVPVPFPGEGNTTCAQLNALHTEGQPANVYSHITTDFELKYDSTPPATATTHTFSSGGSWVLGGGATADLGNTVTIRGYPGPGDTERTMLDWSSTRRITAVIVKANGSNVYLYNPGSFGGIPDGIGLETLTGDNQVSHVTFCFEIIGGTTAGDGAISGRVVNSFGVGISNARMTLVDAATGETVSAITNGFGYYTIDNIAVGEFYTLGVSHKRYRFSDPIKAFTLNDSFADVDFVANP